MPPSTNFNTVNVHGKYVGLDGTPVSGSVTFTAVGERLVDLAADTTVIGRTIRVNLVDGEFTVALPCTDDPDIIPTGFTYKVTEDFTGGQSFYMAAPIASVGTGIDITDVVPVNVGTGLGTTLVARSELISLAARIDPLSNETLLSDWPIWSYGNSYALFPAPGYHTAGNHYVQQVADRLGGGTTTCYAIGAKRILDVVSAVQNEAPFPGLITAPVAGAKWPGTTARNGLVVLDSCVNDFGHYSNMSANPVIPAALPTANTKYRDSMTQAYRSVLAYLSSESRVEQSARTATSGTWTHDSVNLYSSGGSLSFTSNAGAYVEFSITPPQSGPLAGVIFAHGYTLESVVGVMAQQTISVDGSVQITRTPSAWERYVGPTGTNVDIGADCYAITLPVDNAAHTIRLAHSGSAGQFMYVDCFTIPSTTPNPLAVMGAEHQVNMTGWTAAQKSIYHANVKALTPTIKAVTAEFPNAVYVPSTLTLNGLLVADGIHPNDRGNTQRANDLTQALLAIRPRLLSRAESLKADSEFVIV